MKTQTVLTGTVFLVGALAAVAVGSMYSWNGLHRPKISLRRALEMATEAIDDDNFYCVGAYLYGNEEGAATPGAWNLIFSRTNGRKKYVAVPFNDYNDKVMVTDVLPRLPGPDCKVHSFKDVERVFREILDGIQPDAAIAVEDDKIVISHATRKFLVHTRNEDGTFSHDVHATVGPSCDGFVMRVREVSSGSEKRARFDLQSYFNRAANRFVTDDPAKELLVTLDFGERVPEEVVVRLFKPFGPAVLR